MLKVGRMWFWLIIEEEGNKMGDGLKRKLQINGLHEIILEQYIPGLKRSSLNYSLYICISFMNPYVNENELFSFAYGK